MEDSYCCIQDLKVDDKISVSYYAVFDGHGGDRCAFYLRNNLHKDITRRLMDPYEGIVNAENLNKQLVDCLKKAFNDCDMEFKKQHADCAK